jgi:hypothetical protein
MVVVLKTVLLFGKNSLTGIQCVLPENLVVDQFDDGHSLASLPVAALAERLYQRVVFKFMVDSPPQDAGAFSVVDAERGQPRHKGIVKKIFKLRQGFIHRKPVQVEFRHHLNINLVNNDNTLSES